MDRNEFRDLYHDLRRGRITRRHFMAVTGLGVAPPEGGDLGDTLIMTTWPNYHDQKTLDRFKELTGVTVQLNIKGSNEEMLAELLVGGTGWDVLVPTNYTLATYGRKGDVAKLHPR